jgi:hypothetical protein
MSKSRDRPNAPTIRIIGHPRYLERSLGFYRDVLGLTPFGLEEFNRCSRSLGNPHVEEFQTTAHEGAIFPTAVRLGAYSEVGYLVSSFRVLPLGL